MREVWALGAVAVAAAVAVALHAHRRKPPHPLRQLRRTDAASSAHVSAAVVSPQVRQVSVSTQLASSPASSSMSSPCQL